MRKLRVFISSVQSEFAEERQMLFDYLTSDPLFGLFFEPFLFEQVPADNRSASMLYLAEVERCDLYIGLFGKQYGYEDSEGISPTEREFDHACKHHKTRLIFITDHAPLEREAKELALIKKSEQVVVRKQFSSMLDLKSAVYSSLVRYLEEIEYIRTAPFDATLHKEATLSDLDEEKIRNFVFLSKAKRKFPLSTDASIETILTHLNLHKESRITNAAILLFGKQPQRFFLASEVKCAHFHGRNVSKPIPSYQVYKGDVFQLVDQAVDFVLSKIDLEIGTRELSVQVPVQYEIPKEAVTEAIVNAIVHKDYTSNGSVQVMLFKDRLEVWNPGHLPFGLTPDKLRIPHNSIPANLLLAEPMYLTGYIERMGTGTIDIINRCKDAGLKKAPEFIQEEIFKTIIWRNEREESVTKTDPMDSINAGDVAEKVGEKVGEKITENQFLIIKNIEKDPYISAKKMAENIGISSRKIEENITKLKKKGLITRIGPAKGGHWEIINNEEK